MTGPILSFLAIVLCILLGLAVHHYRLSQIANQRADIAAEIKRAKQKHKAVKHLYRKAEQLNRKELAS